MSEPPARSTPDPQADHIPAVEWVVAAFGMLLLLAAVAFLVREAARGAGRPPDVMVAVDTVVSGRAGWLVRARATNVGDETSADIAFRGVLTTPSGTTIVREARLDYLPGHSGRRFGLVFPVDPRAGTLQLEVLGHQEP